MIIDCHCHIFTKQVIRNVTSRTELVEELGFDIDVEHRSDPQVLDESAGINQVAYCILLPTAPPDKVQTENDRYLSIASSSPRLRTLATLHPQMSNIAYETERMFIFGVPGFKFSSFSQRFDIASDDVEKMLKIIQNTGTLKEKKYTIVFDTFNRADTHFGTCREHITTPAKLNSVVVSHPEINFLAAHMGGLAADYDDNRQNLKPAANLYLDTSNAAHTLSTDQFVELLQWHGSDHILFGTDWPGFNHASEIPLIESLLNKAGFDQHQKEAVFLRNAERLFFNPQP
jgi:uncharacterized protein